MVLVVEEITGLSNRLTPEEDTVEAAIGAIVVLTTGLLVNIEVRVALGVIREALRFLRVAP